MRIFLLLIGLLVFRTSAVGGSAGGYAGGFTGGYILSGGDLEFALESDWNGLKSGAAVGGAVGVVSGYGYVRQQGINPWTGESSLKPLGRGSMGRTVARSMSEKWTMKFAKDNPRLGEVIMENMGDSRWSGWSKMQYIHRPADRGRTVTIHYVGKWENGVLKAVDDFKFK